MTVVIVTGASSGIGRATAIRLAARGDTVVLAARRDAELTAVTDEITAAGGQAHPVRTDVTDPEQAEELVARALAVSGRIDVLINNAGVGGDASVLAPDEQVRAMIEVNLMAPVRLMRAVVPIMREQRSGSIVNIGSVAGEIGIGGVYSATKFALRGMNDSVRRELTGTGIGVTLIEPGFVATELTAHRSGLPGPEIVAAAVERALSRPRRRMVVPAKYRAAILFANAFPSITDRLYAGRAATKRPTAAD
ncbi:SDR family NAD(P)-dependent oxidoreductase [Actinoplanes couchii]|uniref:Short-chain dehydrogenase n=1 Tax=Actinoplanes couchii TaxID=403638 RepID=A0ABQ3X955_9ACTN|nr:SDR family NAD(P)-dependent oxidoreductase [Actinoplanes couchii]MDR6325787.1 NAD(P)-dependent dehydrogenase (short-subunit alcohol dehydrogenase family) [Actinoplanes couchii]GID55045.1 short-chain dehydrogenase [Actinoplanes couchii]